MMTRGEGVTVLVCTTVCVTVRTGVGRRPITVTAAARIRMARTMAAPRKRFMP
jgi:hypothetical protein